MLTILIHQYDLEFQDHCIIYRLFNLLRASDFIIKNALLPVDLLMEHIQEIRSLRKRLEESIKTNENLRRQLERQGAEFDKGKEEPSQRAVQACD